MRLNFNEYEQIEQEVEDRYDNDMTVDIKFPSIQEADEMMQDLDRKKLVELLYILKVRPFTDVQKNIQRYIRAELYRPEILEIYDETSEPCNVTIGQMADINRVIKKMGDNIFPDEWFPTMEDIERCMEGKMDINTVKFLVYIGKSSSKKLTKNQRSVKAFAKKIICSPEYVNIIN